MADLEITGEQGGAAGRKRLLEVVFNAPVQGVDEMLVVGLLCDRSEIVWKRAGELLAYKYPWLLVDASESVPLERERGARYRFGNEWVSLRSALSKALTSSSASIDCLEERFARVPGCVPDVIEEFRLASRDREADRLARCLADERLHGGTSRQILFATTYACNLNCSYCYVKTWEKRFKGHMTIDDFRIAVRWCLEQGLDHVILGGGEPTVHPAFVDLVQEARRCGVTFSLTSNGLFGKCVRDQITPDVFSELICHAEQDVMRREDGSARVLSENIDALRATGVNVRIRYTLTSRSDSQERRMILALASAHGVRTVNYGFAFQNVDKNNERFSYGRSVSLSFDKIMNGFMDEAAEFGLQLHLSKPFPFCHVTQKTLQRISVEGGLRTACTAARRKFSMNLTINPDLTTLPCNALSLPGPKITDFKDLHEAGQYHASVLRPLFRTPWRSKCKRCVLYYRGLCQGACLSEHRQKPVKSTRAEGVCRAGEKSEGVAIWP